MSAHPFTVSIVINLGADSSDRPLIFYQDNLAVPLRQTKSGVWIRCRDTTCENYVLNRPDDSYAMYRSFIHDSTVRYSSHGHPIFTRRATYLAQPRLIYATTCSDEKCVNTRNLDNHPKLISLRCTSRRDGTQVPGADLAGGYGICTCLQSNNVWNWISGAGEICSATLPTQPVPLRIANAAQSCVATVGAQSANALYDRGLFVHGLDVPASVSVAEITVSFWFSYTSGTATDAAMFQLTNLFSLKPDTFYASTKEVTVAAALDIVSTGWHHFVIAYSSVTQSAQVYVDQYLLFELNRLDTTELTIRNALTAKISSYAFTSNRASSGSQTSSYPGVMVGHLAANANAKIDDIRIYAAPIADVDWRHLAHSVPDYNDPRLLLALEFRNQDQCPSGVTFEEDNILETRGFNWHMSNTRGLDMNDTTVSLESTEGYARFFNTAANPVIRQYLGVLPVGNRYIAQMRARILGTATVRLEISVLNNSGDWVKKTESAPATQDWTWLQTPSFLATASEPEFAITIWVDPAGDVTSQEFEVDELRLFEAQPVCDNTGNVRGRVHRGAFISC